MPTNNCPSCGAFDPMGDEDAWHKDGCVVAMTEEELRQRYNDAPKPNDYGDELLNRIHARDREAFGMSADNPALRRK